MILIEEEYNEVVKYYDEKAEASLNYRKSLVEKSRFKKLAHWWYIGTVKYWQATVEYEKDGKIETYTSETYDFPCKYNSLDDVFQVIRLTLDVPVDKIKSFKAKKIKLENQSINSSPMFKIGYIFFIHKTNKWVKKGFNLRGREFKMLNIPHKFKFGWLKILNAFNLLKPKSVLNLWYCEDIYSMLIIKLTISALAIQIYGNTLFRKNKVREMWKTRQLLLELSDFENTETNEVNKRVEEKYGLKNVYSELVHINKEEFIETGFMDDIESISQLSSPSKYSLVFDPTILSKTFSIPLDTKENRIKILEKEEEVSEFVSNSVKEIGETHEERIKELWIKTAINLANLERWWD